jgi:hypothetical protein
MNERVIMKLLEFEAMVRLISERGALSTPFIDVIIFPFLKF